MKYRYQAKTKEGELQVGFVEASTKDGAASILSGHNLFVLSIEEAEKVRWYDRLATYFNRVRSQDMVVFTRQLSILLESQFPLSRALAVLYDQTSNPALREAVFQASEDVDAGLAFSQALERQSAVFSGFFVSMIRSAEVTGNLDQVAGFLADYTEREAELVSKARTALIYPAIVIALFVIVAFIMITVVFPQIGPVFEQAGVELPWFALALLKLGTFIAEWWFAMIIAFLILVAVVMDYAKTPEGRSLKDELKHKLPVLKKVYLPVTLARFSNASTMLIKGGVPVAQAMEIVGQTVDNIVYRDILHEVANDVREGKTLSESLLAHPEIFPPMVPQMITVGETSGQLDRIFGRIAAFYSREADAIVSNLVELIQPVLMIAIGILVGILFASILLPLYKLTATVQ